MKVEAVDDGVMGAIHVPEGTKAVKVGTLIATLMEEGESVSDLSKSSAAASSSSLDSSEGPQVSSDTLQLDTKTTSNAPEASQAKEWSTIESARPVNDGERQHVTPVARRLAQEASLDLEQVQGTGPRGRVVKADVEAACLKTSMLNLQRRLPQSDIHLLSTEA